MGKNCFDRQMNFGTVVLSRENSTSYMLWHNCTFQGIHAPPRFSSVLRGARSFSVCLRGFLNKFPPQEGGSQIDWIKQPCVSLTRCRGRSRHLVVPFQKLRSIQGPEHTKRSGAYEAHLDKWCHRRPTRVKKLTEGPN